MEKRILLAFVLSFGVLYAFRAFYSPPTPSPALEITNPSPAVALNSGQNPAADAPRIVVETAPPPPGAVVQSEKIEDKVIENALYTATISNVGGVLKSFKPKAYTDNQGKTIELIDAKSAAQVGWPLAMVTGDPSIDETLSKAQFVPHQDGERLEFEFASGNLHARKSFDFNPLNYEFTVETSLTKDGKGLPHAIVWQGGFGDQSVPYDATKHNVVYQSESDFERLNAASIEAQQDITTPRIGVEDQYFLAIFLLQESSQTKVSKKDFRVEPDTTVATPYIVGPSQPETTTHLYLGPKAESGLRRADPGLLAVIDYGMFEFIARPLMLGLLWIHSYVGNFGWAIVILTIMLNFLLFPLRLKQQVSMQKMSKIQPQMRALQDKYKKLKATDPKRAEHQREMMDLYKQHGVNPMGGCLPLLLQMPFFFAILAILGVAIELRLAPWLWINDLSQYDPFYVLPVLFAVTMIITQKMTPTTVDPAQAKMMMIMPVMLSFMFLWVSSGLALYWTASNVVGIGQQYFINKFWSTAAVTKTKGRRKNKDSGPEN